MLSYLYNVFYKTYFVQMEFFLEASGLKKNIKNAVIVLLGYNRLFDLMKTAQQ